MTQTRTVSVPAQRLARWVDGFHQRHGGSSHVVSGDLLLEGTDGASARLRPPFPADHVVTAEAFIDHASTSPRCAVILVRRGGFAAAIVEGGIVQASDIGRRHVQGRTAAGGWSQQRFARRRQKQANELVDAAAAYANDVIVPRLPVDFVVTGGDRTLVQQVLDDQRLRALRDIASGPHLAVPDPRRDVIAALPELLTTVRIDIIDP